MKLDDNIRKLRAQIDKLYEPSTIFLSWLDTTLEIIETIFGKGSTALSNFKALGSDYKYHIIYHPPVKPLSFGLKKILTDYEKRAEQNIQGLIQQLEHQKQENELLQQQLKLKNQKTLADNKKSLENFERQEKERELFEKEQELKTKAIPPSPTLKKRKFFVYKFDNVRKIYEISLPVILSTLAVSATLMGLLYNVGLNQGKTNFSTETQRIYNSNENLVHDTSTYLLKIRQDSVVVGNLKEELLKRDSVEASYKLTISELANKLSPVKK